MKKIFTFLFCAIIISSAFAQTDFKVKSTKTISNKHFVTKKEKDYTLAKTSTSIDPRFDRDKEINKIDYMNNIQVQQVLNDKTLGIWEKRDALDALEFQRIQKVNVIYQKYNGSVASYTAQQLENSLELRQRYDAAIK